MLRLTSILLVGIGVTLAVAGRDLETSPGGTEIAVTRSSSDIFDAGTLAIEDEAGAIERALEATRALDPVQSAEASATSSAVAPASTEQLESEVADHGVVAASRVNLRDGPSTANRVLDQVVLGQEVEILNRTADGWAQIRVVDTGREAYIFDRFIKTES
ncbi:SH3 domain-containing protein [Palleronia sp.]|uniref:SH3 domain-containing protein n=1 Tax=Palleronia sp. TaxID=1940284 RepID=UPI0035C81BC5